MSQTTVTNDDRPSPEVAREWLRRWDSQQERYVADREERFAVIADVVASRQAALPLVVDLGCGPGSLATRLLDRLPGASVVAVDADPLLLGLARAAYADRRGLAFVDQDLRDPGWPDALRLPRAADAVVSTTALHWLTGPELAAVYRACASLLRPGGVFVNGDHLGGADGQAQLAHLLVEVRDAAAVRAGVTDNEDWSAWWAGVGAAPELAALVGERGARPLEHSVPNAPTYAEHVEHLRAAGFAEVGTVWQSGDDRVLVAVR